MDERTKRQKLEAMARQTASPHEAAVARAKLAAMGPAVTPAPKPTFGHPPVYRTRRTRQAEDVARAMAGAAAASARASRSMRDAAEAFNEDQRRQRTHEDVRRRTATATPPPPPQKPPTRNGTGSEFPGFGAGFGPGPFGTNSPGWFTAAPTSNTANTADWYVDMDGDVVRRRARAAAENRPDNE